MVKKLHFSLCDSCSWFAVVSEFWCVPDAKTSSSFRQFSVASFLSWNRCRWLRSWRFYFHLMRDRFLLFVSGAISSETGHNHKRIFSSFKPIRTEVDSDEWKKQRPQSLCLPAVFTHLNISSIKLLTENWNFIILRHRRKNNLLGCRCVNIIRSRLPFFNIFPLSTLMKTRRRWKSVKMSFVIQNSMKN